MSTMMILSGLNKPDLVLGKCRLVACTCQRWKACCGDGQGHADGRGGGEVPVVVLVGIAVSYGSRSGGGYLPGRTVL